MRKILDTLIQCGQLDYMNINIFIHSLQNFGRFEEDFKLDKLSERVALLQIFRNTHVFLNNIPIGSTNLIVLNVLWSIVP